MTSLDEREGAVLTLLDNWPWNLQGVIIGGYAVVAYGPPRYSNDVDIVISESSARRVRDWLKGEGFALAKHSVPNPENFVGQVQRYDRKSVTLDLLVGTVRDREAKVDIPEAWISKDARREKLVTLSGRTMAEVPIARPEALWALKLEAGRPRDLSDLFAISDTPFDRDQVQSLFRDLMCESLIAKLVTVRSRLKSRKLFADSLSRRQLGSPSDPKNVRRWERFTSIVDKIVHPLETEREPTSN